MLDEKPRPKRGRAIVGFTHPRCRFRKGTEDHLASMPCPCCRRGSVFTSSVFTTRAPHAHPRGSTPSMTAFKRGTLAASLAALTFGLTATADDGKPDNFRARLSSYNEVHFIAGTPNTTPIVPPALRGAISSVASGSFRAEIDDRRDVIHYE